jgi:hypothetical protein
MNGRSKARVSGRSLRGTVCIGSYSCALVPIRGQLFPLDPPSRGIDAAVPGNTGEALCEP